MKKPSLLVSSLLFCAGILAFCGLAFQACGKEETQPRPIESMENAAITISCSEAVHIKPLETRQAALYDSKGGGKIIRSISPELSGWQFVSTPWHTVTSYEIRVNQACVIYAFGGGTDERRTAQKWIGDQEVGKWEDANGAISQFRFCFRRKVAAGECIKLKGIELHLAAKSIELVSEGKLESATQKSEASNRVAESPAAPISSAAATPPPTPSPTLPTSRSAQNDGSHSTTKILSQQALNATSWALAPLDQTVPGDIRQNLTALREDLLDEGKAAPRASNDAYKLGSLLCDNLIAALDERDQALVGAGYRAAQADANTKVTSQSLEARRNYLMSWPQYAREKDERSEIQRQQTNNTVLVKESVKTAWFNRAAALRKSLDSLYAKYRDALRNGGK